MTFFLYIVVGAVTGLFSGMLGIGGGLIIVPSLMAIFSYFNVANPEQIIHLSIGTSLACAITNLIISTWRHNQQGTIKWPVVKAILPGVLLGSLLLGPILMLYTKGAYLKLLFSGFCLVLSLYMLLVRKLSGKETLPSRPVLCGIGFIVAAISTLLGIAGGAIIGAMFNIWHMNPRNVVGTIAAIGIPIAIPGTIGLMVVGFHQPNLPSWSTGYIYWPALIGIALPSLITVPIGAKITHAVSVPLLQKLFAGLVLVVGLKMLI